MKRKVHAQRKFAQGAFIPPLSNNNTITKTDAHTPVREERSSAIVHSQLTARNLLDIVSFQSIHTHLRPVVLLERMTPKENAIPITNGHESPFHSSIQSIPLRVRAKLRRMALSASGKIIKLRPRRNKVIKEHIMKLRRTSKQNLRMRLKRVGSTSDLEDDRPLKYLKLKRVEPPPAPSENTDEVECRGRTSLAQEKTQALTEKEEEAEIRVTRSAAHEKSHGVKEKLLKRKKADGSSVYVLRIPRDPNTSDKPFKEPALPTRFNKTGAVPKKTVAVASTSKEPVYNAPVPKKTVAVASTSKEPVYNAPDQPKNSAAVASTSKKPNASAPEPAESTNDETPGTSKQFYCSRGIERWLNSYDGDKESSSTRDRAPSPCPSESLKTMKDVMNANAADLAKRCFKCNYCSRVQLVEQISSLMNKNRRPSAGDAGRNNDDVYEFDAEDDASNPPPFYLHRKRNPRAQDTTDKEPTASADDDEQHLYLDLQKDSPHIIEITSVKVPNSNKRMMKAKLIPKSEAHTTEDFPLIEHENLLDQLLQTLIINQSSSSDAQKLITSQTTINDAQINNTAQAIRNSAPIEARRAGRPEKTVKPPAKRANTRANDKPSKSKSDGPRPEKAAKLLEAPTFYPTEAEFNDPIAYIEKIAPSAAKYGLCKIIAPPNFKPKCILGDDMKFNVHNHYVARLFSRWGPAAREICAMRAYLATQNINFFRVPLLESLEVNLPKLYSVVQHNGGLKNVIEKKRWSRVAEEMRFSKSPNMEKLLDSYYVKYLLPYDTASNHEHNTIMSVVERCWNRKHHKLAQWASNPLHHQKKLLGESDSSEEDTIEDPIADKALHEAEECVVAGRPMNLTVFKKVAAHAMTIYMGNPNATTEEIEKEYWRLVLFGTEHVCVNAASIDTAASGYGFSKSKNDPGGKHPWNLKMLSNSTNNLLRSLSGVLGVTVPTLHLGMVFSTCCWHRDPHGLPWIEYLHQGPPKIWYGIAEEQSENFRSAVEALCPTSCQNKYIWLSSDITMIPPKLLLEHKVTLSQTQQNPGEFVIVFPKAYSCSISTGFTVSESVYFATVSWLKSVHEIFQELRSSCEPTTFSLEQLLLALAKDPRSSFGVLHTTHSTLTSIVEEELRLRKHLVEKGVAARPPRNQGRQRNAAAWNEREAAECQICRCTLYLSKVTGVLSKKSEFCLLHAQRMLEMRQHTKSEISRMEIVLFYTEKQLHGIINNLKKRMTTLSG